MYINDIFQLEGPKVKVNTIFISLKNIKAAAVISQSNQS